MRSLLSTLADGEFHSGQALGEALGVSRAAIWKQLKKLDELGVRLHSVKGRGYRVAGGLDLLDPQRIEAGLEDGVRARLGPIALALSLPSTNEAALQGSAQGGGGGRLYLAERQTAGKGRRGRTWVSPFARNLYFSLVWDFAGGAAALEGLSLVVGLAVRHGLMDSGVEGIDLKWPNDLLVDGRKLGGILLEMTGDASGQCQVVIGVGINVAMPDEVAAEIDQPWIDVRTAGGVSPGRNLLLAAVLNRLVPSLERFSEQGFASFRAEWEACNAHQGRQVVLQTSRVQIQGRCLGVDDKGALLLETEDGVQACHGGELSLRGLE
nr:bifunctional biotin--[acetyl-CoA-carboxylase] ligase/biotin operon repressor BirA [Motiliproteus sp. SC1-56]